MWRRLKRRAWKTPPGRRIASVSLQLNNSPRRADGRYSQEQQTGVSREIIKDEGQQLSCYFYTAAIFIPFLLSALMCSQKPCLYLSGTPPHTSGCSPTWKLWLYCPFQLQWVRGLEDLEISKSTLGRKVGQTHLLKSRTYVPREKTY